MSQTSNEIAFKHGFHDHMGRFPIEGQDFYFEECADDPLNILTEDQWRDRGIRRARAIRAAGKPGFTLKEIQDYNTARAERLQKPIP